MFEKYIGKLIKFNKKLWLIESIYNGEAELWYNGNSILVPLDDLDTANIIVLDIQKDS